MIVPHRSLSPEALAALIEEYVSRDGTELTDASIKIVEVAGALARGELVIVFDVETESCNLVRPQDVADEG